MIIINGVDYSKNLVLPVKWQKTRDESLDLVVASLKGLTLSIPFEPMTRVQLDDEYYLIAYDKVTQTRFGAKKIYTHDLTLIEETKKLEKYILDSCTSTNPLIHDYLGTATNVYVQRRIVQGIRDETDYYYNETLKTTLLPNATFPSLIDFMNVTYKESFSYGVILLDKDDNNISGTGGITTPFIPNNNLEVGEYTIYYSIFISGINYIQDENCKIYIIDEIIPKDDYTITDVVNRILAILETKRTSESPRFTFNSEQATYYSTIIAPEFSFTKCTLREALKQIGWFIHAEPRLINNEIYFDSLSPTEYATLPAKHISFTSSYDIEQFCTSIDTNVDNLVNNDSLFQGTITEPFTDGVKTPRVETGAVEITDTTAFIETLYPIEEIRELYLGFLPDGTEIGTITPFVYEKTEYSTLSSYENTFPKAKSYAIYYEQGKNNIYGLNFTSQDATPTIFKIPSLINIINAKLGTSYSNFSSIPIAKMQYSITYVSSESARVKQVKTKLNETTNKSVLIYNQTANKIDNDYYGENLKGFVARLGNIEKTITYNVKNKTDIPSVNLKFDNNYIISVVKIEKYNNYYKVELGLSKNFNRLNQFIEINNNIRQYEISATQVIDRYVVYEDFLVIGDEIGEKSSLVTERFLNIVKQAFNPAILEANFYDNNKISSMVLKTKTESNNEITQVVLPTITSTFGNSVLYQVKFNNNFGAGNRVDEFSSDAKGIQGEVQYCDDYGEVEYLQIKGYSVPIDTLPTDYASSVELGAKLPYILDSELSSNILFNTETDDIVLKKDSREQIGFGYQIHCATTEENIVIGSGLAKKLLVRETTFERQQDVDFVILNRNVGEFEQFIDVGDIVETLTITLSVDAVNKNITFSTATATKVGKSIVAIDKTLDINDEPFNELIFAINLDVNIGDTIAIPPMRFRRLIDK